MSSQDTSRTGLVVVPCSGIGKSFGAVSREAAYEICEHLLPGRAQLVALARLVQGDAESRAAVSSKPVISIDGCKRACAATMVKQNGGTIVREISVLDVFRRHKDLKPEGIAELNDAGLKLARVLSEEAVGSLPPAAAAPAQGDHHD